MLSTWILILHFFYLLFTCVIVVVNSIKDALVHVCKKTIISRVFIQTFLLIFEVLKFIFHLLTIFLVVVI